ncbi:SLC13 family permease [Nocardioides sp. YIM B13467]|uniref:SLC13 family permease n=1 Tax=Nocardioides sp. YIM B13467 TaxID=3366294 RepID=UPI00366ED4BF
MVYFVSIAVLAALFAIATTRPINMGLLGFAAAFIVGGAASGFSAEEVISYFPGDLFVIVVGLTLLFGIARANGTVDLIMRSSLRLVRSRPWAIVWLMFFLAAVLMALGSPMAVAMLAPIAMPLARRYKIDPLLMGMMISHGALSTAFSPITVYSAGVGTVAGDLGIDVPPLTLFFVPFTLNVVFAVALFAVRGRDLLRSRPSADPTNGSHDDGSSPLARGRGAAGGDLEDAAGSDRSSAQLVATLQPTVTTEPAPTSSSTRWEPVVTLLSIGVLLVAVLSGLDVGVTSMCLSAFLLLIAPRRAEAAMGSIAWPATLLVCGVVTYMGVLTANGTINFAGEKATELPWPLLTALVLFLAVGIISAVGSSIGIILISLPIAAPLLATGDLPAVSFIAALAFCATVVDVSPFSTNGVIVLSSAEVEDRRRLQRRMLCYTGYVVVAAPILALLGVVVPTSL